VDIEEFYDENPVRRASEEFEYGSDWSDATGVRWALSWVKATGELHAMAEAAEPIVTDMFGDEHLQRMPTNLLTVLVLGVVDTRPRLDQILSGWANAMATADSLAWVRDRLAHGPPTGQHDAASADIAFEISGDDDRASVVILTAITALHEKVPPSETAKLVGYQQQALIAGSDPTAEWHRAYACARWADQIVAMPTHHHLAADAARALEIVRELGVTFGAEVRDLEYLPFGKAVSPHFQIELTWVYEAVHVAAKVAEKIGWDALGWEQLVQSMLDIASRGTD
jgi:hypothetical protein